MYDRSWQILLKNSEIEPLRKSRFRARRFISADSPHGRAYGSVARGEKLCSQLSGPMAPSSRSTPSRGWTVWRRQARFCHFSGDSHNEDGSRNEDVEPRLGVIMNPYAHAPVVRQLFVSEPFQNTIAVVSLVNFGVTPNQVFGLKTITRIGSPWLNLPVDLALVQRDKDNVNLGEQYNARSRFGLLRLQPRQQYDRPHGSGRQRGGGPRCPRRR
jgi:hypothetical protein